MCTGTAISFYVPHLHLLVTGAGAAQVQTPTGIAEGFLHLTGALHLGTRSQETPNASSSPWHSEQCSGLVTPGAAQQISNPNYIARVFKNATICSKVLTAVNELPVQQQWGNKDFQHKAHHVSDTARVPGQLHISISVLMNPHLRFSFLEKTPASSWVRFDNKMVRDNLQSCCLYPKFSIAYRTALWEMLNCQRFIATWPLPSTSPSKTKQDCDSNWTLLYFYCAFCKCLKMPHKTVWIELSTYGTCKRQTDPPKFS